MTTNKSGAGWVDPFLRPTLVTTIPSLGLNITVKPDDAERAALAKALNLASVDNLIATFKLMNASRNAVLVTGQVKGLVHPICVVSLEPFPFEVNEPVELRFSEAVEPAKVEEEDFTSEDPPDEIVNGMIDLGKVTTEFLTLAVPVFPRKPDASFVKPVETGPESPFAVLNALKPKKP